MSEIIGFSGNEIATEVQLRTRLETNLATLENAADNWATLTAAQKDAAQRLSVRTSARIVRVFLRHLETTGGAQ